MPEVNRWLIGRTFNRWTVLDYRALPDESFLVRCQCGSGERWRDANSVKTGRSKSCGCWNVESSLKRFTTHGFTRTPTYTTWQAMKQRCLDTAKSNYRYYGGRGVTICARWRDDFASFLADMGPRPAGASLDRINPDGNYEPSNCRWATRIEQRRNRRDYVSAHA